MTVAKVSGFSEKQFVDLIEENLKLSGAANKILPTSNKCEDIFFSFRNKDWYQKFGNNVFSSPSIF